MSDTQDNAAPLSAEGVGEPSILLYHATLGTADQVAALYAAFAAAQGEYGTVVKNRSVKIATKDRSSGQVNGSYTFRYADLEEITTKTRPALSKNGLGTMQLLGRSTRDTGTSIFTRLVHAKGACIEVEIPLASQKERGDIKDYGSMVSYLRRYAKAAILDIAADDDVDENGQDDDGQGGDPMRPSQTQRKPRQPRQQKNDPADNKSGGNEGGNEGGQGGPGGEEPPPGNYEDLNAGQDNQQQNNEAGKNEPAGAAPTKTEQVHSPEKTNAPQPGTGAGTGQRLSVGQLKTLRRTIERNEEKTKRDEPAVCNEFQVGCLEELLFEQLNDAIKFATGA